GRLTVPARLETPTPPVAWLIIPSEIAPPVSDGNGAPQPAQMEERRPEPLFQLPQLLAFHLDLIGQCFNLRPGFLGFGITLLALGGAPVSFAALALGAALFFQNGDGFLQEFNLLLPVVPGSGRIRPGFRPVLGAHGPQR